MRGGPLLLLAGGGGKNLKLLTALHTKKWTGLQRKVPVCRK